jgi:MFS superfamily sulfate permease-like transporter
MAHTRPLTEQIRTFRRGLPGFTFAGLPGDLAAGLTLAAVALPEQMATARLGGFAPEIGLTAFIAAAIGFSLLGASRSMSVGADSTITPIFAGALAGLAASGSPAYAGLAAALALLVALLTAGAGVLRLGWIADLLSAPVLTGFLAGIAAHIVLSQAPALLGAPEESGQVYQRLAMLWTAAPHARPAALAVGLGVFAAIVAIEKISERAPGALIAVAAATAATTALGLDRKGLAVLGALPSVLAPPHPPAFSLASLPALLVAAVVVSLGVMVQSAAVSRSFAEPGADPDVDRDYLGVGLANALSAFAGAFPVNASPPRTAIAAASGGRSQATSLFAALLVLLLALFGARLLARIPTAALAGVLLYVAKRIFRIGDFARILKSSPAEFALAAVTCALIVLLPIQSGVGLGVALSLAHGVYTITRTRPIPFERVGTTSLWWPAAEPRPGAAEPRVRSGALVMGFQAPLSFLNAYEFRRGMMQAIEGEPGLRLFVLEASSIVEIDYTAAQVLGEVIDQVHGQGAAFAVARLESLRAQAAFERFGVNRRLGPGRLFHTVAEAVEALSGG